MKEKGFEARAFGITGEGTLRELMNIKSEHIENENLEELLCKAIIQGEYDGITAFSKSLKYQGLEKPHTLTGKGRLYSPTAQTSPAGNRTGTPSPWLPRPPGYRVPLAS